MLKRIFLNRLLFCNAMIIKENYEDFLVDEIPLDERFDEGNYQVYILRKKNYTTQRAISHIAKSLKIPLKNVGFAGTKDKQAITTQYITIGGVKKDRVLELKLKDIALEFKGYRNEALRLGDLEGNKFNILVRGVKVISVPQRFAVPNYFDEQRFSTCNLEIGKLILKKKYEEAVKLILETDKDFRELIQDHLQKQSRDFVGALRILPRKTLLFYVHSVQSYFFNERLAEFIRSQYESKDVSYSKGVFSFPKEVLVDVQQELGELIGFDSACGGAGIEPMDFLNKSLPELCLEGTQRNKYSYVANFTLQEEEKGVRVQFSLSKGCYATIVLKQVF